MIFSPSKIPRYQGISNGRGRVTHVQINMDMSIFDPNFVLSKWARPKYTHTQMGKIRRTLGGPNFKNI